MFYVFFFNCLLEFNSEAIWKLLFVEAVIFFLCCFFPLLYSQKLKTFAI